MLAVSGLDVAFVSALAALGAAIAAPLSAWFVAIESNRHDRWAKTCEDLRDAYTGLLRSLYARQVNIEVLGRMLEMSDVNLAQKQSVAEEDAAARVERMALVGSFAAPAVSEAVEEWDDQFAEVVAVVKGLTSGEEEPDEERAEEIRLKSAAEIRACLASLRDPMRKVRDAIRTDLRNQDERRRFLR